MRKLTPEEQRIRDYCESQIKVLPYEYERRWVYEDIVKFIDTAPEHETCKWRLNGCDMYENCTGTYKSKYNDVLVCDDCGKPIERVKE